MKVVEPLRPLRWSHRPCKGSGMARKKATTDSDDRDFNTEMFGAMCALEDATADLEAPPKKDSAAVMLGSKGGKKGGPARQALLSAEERRALGQKAAEARWGKKATPST